MIDGQLSIFDRLEPKPEYACKGCICQECMRWWRKNCPYGGCYDEHRADVMPYYSLPPGTLRTLQLGWRASGEHTHWCSGGTTYPEHMCEHHVPYEKPLRQECLNANVTKWKDGQIDCPLVDVWGCEKCMRVWEQRRARDANEL